MISVTPKHRRSAAEHATDLLFIAKNVVQSIELHDV